ncbi:hypothetical protein [Clostridium tagluense]|uniref:Uncharacterized protein n=1 Tax=Clostridium tagluense TaxID=360422 RepID=A0A401ULM0_9CLOT|nr:hypothetical protein [Clostridium tagluense]GCD10425.1 hypothetical protein Ctaglu_20480 [Clostridium tagluense]
MPKVNKDITKKSTVKKATPKKVTKIPAKGIFCSCCGEEKEEGQFYNSQSEIFKFHKKIGICKECIVSVFDIYMEKYNGDNQATIYRMCELLDIYYDERLIASSQTELEGRGVEGVSSLIIFYMKNIAMPQYKGKTFENRKITYEHSESIVLQNERLAQDLTESQIKSKADVIRLLASDPFDGYDLADQKYLYTDVVPYLDEDTIEDSFKCGVIIQIVINNNQIRKANVAINSLSGNVASMVKNSKDISALADITTKWNQQNDKLSKENNIALKHRGGSGSKNSTLGSMMKNLRELGFEKAEQNYYDMSKAYGMKLSAEISNQSIMDIIHFDDSTMNDMFKMQREELQKLQDKELDYKEQIRVLINESNKK